MMKERDAKFHAMTLEGLADVETGRYVSGHDVDKWLESLDTDNPLPMPEPEKGVSLECRT
jgi:predicted transcriptional regulator